MWLFPSRDDVNGGRKLGFRDLNLKRREHDSRVSYETVHELLDRFNREQADGPNPVPGKIISVESRDVNDLVAEQGGGANPTNIASDRNGLTCYNPFSLRIFFYRGLATRERFRTYTNRVGWVDVKVYAAPKLAKYPSESLRCGAPWKMTD